MTTKVLTAHIPLPLAEKVDQLAARLERSRAWIIKQALSAWIDHEEERQRLTIEAMADVDAGRFIDHQAVQEWAESLSTKTPHRIVDKQQERTFLKRNKRFLLISLIAGLHCFALRLPAGREISARAYFPPEIRNGDQTDLKPAPQILRHDAAAVIKLIPVRVLDRDGRPITDLRKDDFVLFDNQERKTITEFEVHRLTEINQTLEKAEAALGPTPLPEMNRKYFLFLDIQAADVDGTANAKHVALEFIETKLRPGDEVALLYYAPMSGLNMKEYLTGDKNKIRKAIENLKVVTVDVSPTPLPYRGLDETARDDLDGKVMVTRIHDREGSARLNDPSILNMFARSGLDFQANLAELSKALSYIPGTKNIVFFSSRVIPKDLGRAFASSNIPVFVVNTQNWIMRGGVKQKYLWLEHPLKDFAEASGGRYFADVIDSKTIADDIQALSGNYYVLGYYINEQWDGKLHQIKVEVNRSECHVLVQEGYYDPHPFAQWTDIEKKLHLYDLAFAGNPASVDVGEVPMEALFIKDDRSSNALFLMKIAVNEKTGLPPGKTELFTIIFDKDNRSVQAIRGEMNCLPLSGKTVFLYSSASLPPGEYKLCFVGRNLETGQAVRGKTELMIPTSALSGLTFYSPLLLAPDPDPKYIRLAEPKKESERSALIHFYPLLPKDCAPLVKTMETDDRKIFVIIPAENRSGQSPKVNLTFRLVRDSTREEFLPETKILEMKRIGPTRSAILIEMILPDLNPGKYSVEIEATDSSAGGRYVLRSSFEKK